MEVEFDDEWLVANAGVVVLATLSRRLGLERLVDRLVSLGKGAGAARWGRKVISLVHAIALGADSIHDADVLRAGSTEAHLGHRAMAPSTLERCGCRFSIAVTQHRRIAERSRRIGPA